MDVRNSCYKNQGIHVITAIFTVEKGIPKVLLIKRKNEPFSGEWCLTGGALQNNEELTYTIQAILSNNNKHFKNFFSTEVITPLKQLNVHLTLEDINVKKYYTQKISNSPMNVRTELPKEYNYVSPSHWYVPNPELNFEYKIFW